MANTEPSETGATEGEPGDSADRAAIRYALEGFRRQQRLLASLESGPLSQLASLKLGVDAMNSLRESVSRSVSLSISFAPLSNVVRPLDVTSLGVSGLADLANSVDVSALARANELILTSTAAYDAARPTVDISALTPQALKNDAIVRRSLAAFEAINFRALRERLDRWFPTNLLDVHELDAVAQLALDEGLPLAWLPRPDIVRELVAAGATEARRQILLDRFEEILDDCDEVLSGIQHEWAEQSRMAALALRQPDLYGPAQSHAANVIDSIVLAIHGGRGRDVAQDMAVVPIDDLPLQVAAEHLALRPLFLGFTEWYAGRGEPIPDHFARHATAHAVGQPNVFTPIHALVAVMLATSLTVQFTKGDPENGGQPGGRG